MNGNKVRRSERDNERMRKKRWIELRDAFSAWAESLKLRAGLADVKKMQRCKVPTIKHNVQHKHTNTHTLTVSQCIICSQHIKCYDVSSGERSSSILMSGRWRKQKTMRFVSRGQCWTTLTLPEVLKTTSCPRIYHKRCLHAHKHPTTALSETSLIIHLLSDRELVAVALL